MDNSNFTEAPPDYLTDMAFLIFDREFLRLEMYWLNFGSKIWDFKSETGLLNIVECLNSLLEIIQDSEHRSSVHLLHKVFMHRAKPHGMHEEVHSYFLQVYEETNIEKRKLIEIEL